VPLIELTSAYAAVANGSYPVKPVGLANPRAPGLSDRIRTTINGLQPWPERAPMLELLQSAVRHGTGVAAALPIPTYGKTGTTQNHRDALFVGFAGDLVVGVWVGNDDNAPMTGAVVGGTVPAKLWHRFMASALTHEGLLHAPPPERRVTDTIGDAIGAAIDAVRGDGFDGEPPEPPPPPDEPQ